MYHISAFRLATEPSTDAALHQRPRTASSSPKAGDDLVVARVAQALASHSLVGFLLEGVRPDAWTGGQDVRQK